MKRKLYRLKRSILRFINLAHHTPRGWWIVWAGFLNRKGRTLHRAYQSDLIDREWEVVGDLVQHGIAVTQIEPSLLKELQAIKLEVKTRDNSSYLKGAFGRHYTLTDSPLFTFTYSRKILDIVREYMEIAPDLWFSSYDVTIPSSGERVLNQRWHRDPPDRRLVRMFLYLSDVDEESGPFQYVRDSHRGGKNFKTFPSRPPRGCYPPTGMVEATMGDDIQTVPGKAGTLIFCDTNGLHRGGYATKKERIMFTTAYASRSFLKRVGGKPYTVGIDTKKLHPLAQYALEVIKKNPEKVFIDIQMNMIKDNLRLTAMPPIYNTIKEKE